MGGGSMNFQVTQRNNQQFGLSPVQLYDRLNNLDNNGEPNSPLHARTVSYLNNINSANSSQDFSAPFNQNHALYS